MKRVFKIGFLILLLGGVFWLGTRIHSTANAGNAVNVVRIDGVIASGDGANLLALRPDIDRAFDSKPKMVALVINSPGGSPSQSEEIHNYIRRKADVTHVPVITFVEDVGASGGYYVALAGDKLFASNRQSIIGSIGVVSSGFSFKKAVDGLGVNHWVVAQGVNKHRLDPFEEVTATDREWLGQLQAETFEVFKNHVIERRQAEGHKIDPKDYDTLFNGDVWIGEQAVAKGLADGVTSVYEYAAKTYGEETTINIIAHKGDFMDDLTKKFGHTMGGIVLNLMARAQYGL